jgi:hypothetical protein
MPPDVADPGPTRARSDDLRRHGTGRDSRFTGRISWVQLDVGADDHVIDPDERLRTAMARQ